MTAPIPTKTANAPLPIPPVPGPNADGEWYSVALYDEHRRWIRGVWVQGYLKDAERLAIAILRQDFRPGGSAAIHNVLGAVVTALRVP